MRWKAARKSGGRAGEITNHGLRKGTGRGSTTSFASIQGDPSTTARDLGLAPEALIARLEAATAAAPGKPGSKGSLAHVVSALKLTYKAVAALMPPPPRPS